MIAHLIVGLVLLTTPAADDSVDIRIDFSEPARDYWAWKAAVLKGEPAPILVIGGKPKEPTDYSVLELNRTDGVPFAPGRYVGSKRPDGQVKLDPETAVEVRSAPTFPGVQSTQSTDTAVPSQRVTAGGATPVVAGSKSHMCPKCGKGPWTVIEGFNGNGTHNHRCGSCGNVFAH